MSRAEPGEGREPTHAFNLTIFVHAQCYSLQSVHARAASAYAPDGSDVVCVHSGSRVCSPTMQ